MKNVSMIGGVLLVLIGGGIGVYVLSNQDILGKNLDSVQKIPITESDETVVRKENKYVPFSPDVLEESASSRRVLFFYANWCSTCRPADANFTQSLTQIPQDVTLIRVNYNDTETDQIEKDLAKKYGVSYQHTFVQIDLKGNEVTKWNGGQINELLSNLK